MNVGTLALVAALCASSALTQSQAEGASKLSAKDKAVLERYGIRCGLGAAFHKGRRDELLRRLPDGAVFVLRGRPPIRDYLRFQQDKTFWYLTGVATPDAALVLDKASGRHILFLPRPGVGLRMTESWDGEMWDTGDSWVKVVSGFTEVESNRNLQTVLLSLKKADSTFYTSTYPVIGLAGASDKANPANSRQARDPWDGRRGRRSTFRSKLQEKLGVDVLTADRFLKAMRRVKTTEEIDAMRKASRAGALGIAEAMRSTRPGLLEQELEGVIDLVTKRHGAEGPAYQAIIGSGPNSLVLHYIGNKRRMQAGEVVLCDYGPQINYYTTDITRTWPVGGKFTKQMAALYDAVLVAQKAGIEMARPGKTIRDIETVCRRVLTRRGFGRLIRHGTCHLIGMEVHDPQYRGEMRRPLVPGVVFTVEPGLYDPKTNIGIRIEDTIVITEDGCEVLSKDVPKERAEIEKLMAKKGVLDWLDSQKASGDKKR